MERGLTVFQFFYSALLVIVFTAVLSSAICLNLIRKRNVAIPVIGLYACYLVDTLIIFMTETVPGFTEWYNQGFSYSPAIKTIVYLATGFFTLYTWNALMHRSFSMTQMLILVGLGMYQVLIPLMENSALRSWLFFLSYQVFNVAICSYGLWKLHRVDPEDYEGPLGWIRGLLIVTIVFSFLIVVEDSFVIFKYDRYTGSDVRIYSRNLTEDVLRMIYTGFFIRLFLKQLRLTWLIAPEAPSPLVVQHQESQPAIDPRAYARMQFVSQYGLTGRESEVLGLMLAGQTNQQISENLHISMGTVKAHVHNIFLKAEVSHRYELLRMYDSFSSNAMEETRV